MTWMESGRLALWVATVLQGLFVVAYGCRPWWRHFVGRALFVFSVALLLTLVVSLVNTYLTYDYPLEVSVVLLWALAVAIGGQLVALLRQRRQDRRASKR